jgi:hypothetical protein
MRLITFSACVEAVTGLVLIIDPSMVAWLLLGAELSDSGQAVGRVAGFALLALAMACWPERERTSRAATRALLTYNLLAAIFFLYLGFRHEFMGLLLWPAAGLHAALAILLGRIFVVDDRD